LCGDGRIFVRPAKAKPSAGQADPLPTCLYPNPKNAASALLPEACQIFTASNKITVP
jgi:hypothetical protein